MNARNLFATGQIAACRLAALLRKRMCRCMVERRMGPQEDVSGEQSRRQQTEGWRKGTSKEESQ